MKEGKVIGHKLSPVIIIPGDGGNQIEARLTDKPSAPHWFCAKNSDWFRLWLDPSQLLPGYVDCWADNMRQVSHRFDFGAAWVIGETQWLQCFAMFAMFAADTPSPCIA